jgi:hypothetical protein
MNNEITTIKPKRGRRSKKELELLKEKINQPNASNIMINEDIEMKNEINDDTGEDINENVIISEEPLSIECKQTLKKRGRKPKGGKIIQENIHLNLQKEEKPNIILHLKCSMKDLNSVGDHNANFTSPNIESFNFVSSKNELSYELLLNNESLIENTMPSDFFDEKEHETSCDNKEIWRKLKVLEQNLHINNISDKKSACFWCSYDFDNPAIYIPKHYIKDSYHVYGCFCTPECAVAHLMEENIDSSTKFERYHLLNHIYSKIYEYNKNIKPAPNPHYMLDKYYGNLTIQEYRSLLKSERLFLIVDKPLTRILPEFHEDNDDFIINSKIIPSNNYQVKKKTIKKNSNKKHYFE